MNDNSDIDAKPHVRGNGVLQRKLALLNFQLSNLETHLREVTPQAFRESWALRSLTERALQVAIEIIIDIAERILPHENAGPVASASEAITGLVRLQVLKSEQPYRDMIKFRNLLVRQYAEINPNILHDIDTRTLGDSRAFCHEIDLWSAKV